MNNKYIKNKLPEASSDSAKLLDKYNNTAKQFKVIGYYISEVIDMPVYLKKLGKYILSVSSCIGEMHPKMECYFTGITKVWNNEKRQAYQNKMKLNDAQYTSYVETLKNLFDSQYIDSDCRFLRLSDAVYFYKNFCSDISCHLVSISTTPEYFEILADELTDGYGNRLVNGELEDNQLAGYDILGWDIGGFHSFLCNSLQEELPEAVFNELGLLKNNFDEVINFAQRIKGKGEPVEWIPCKVGFCF